MFIPLFFAIVITIAFGMFRYHVIQAGFFWEAYNDEEIKQNWGRFAGKIISGVFAHTLLGFFMFVFFWFLSWVIYVR